MRQSGSFSETEQEFAHTLFQTLLLGGDTEILMRSEAAGSLVLKFSMMRMRSRMRLVKRKHGPRSDDVTTGTVAGLSDILTWREMSPMLGVTPNALRSRVKLWRARMDRKYAPDVIAAEE